MTVRVAHLVSHPIHYQAPLYRELAARPDLDLTVYFYSDASVRGYRDVEFGHEVEWDTPLLEGYRSRFLPSAARTGIQSRYGQRPNWDVLRRGPRRRVRGALDPRLRARERMARDRRRGASAARAC